MMAVARLKPEQAELVERAQEHISAEGLAQLCYEMTAIPSPSGEELALAEFIARRLRAAGFQAKAEPFGGQRANAVARLEGTGEGPTLWVYAPLDTAFSGDVREDEPWLGDRPRPDFTLPPRRDGNKVIGLGAENPKGFAASAIAALEALARAGAELKGDAVLALAGCSMPTTGRSGMGPEIGFGSGIRQLLEMEGKPDFAIVLKPGYAVSHEEVGLVWARIRLIGAVNYTGIRHKGPYRNPILAAARLAAALEEWFGEYSARHTSGLVAPQGSINAIRAGSAQRAAYVPAHCDIHLDLRVAPDSSPANAERELRDAVARLGAELADYDIELSTTATLPGTRTDPQSWIVRSLIRSWESLEGRPHAAVPKGSGASDAAILRSHGIPTARIGLPPPDKASPYAGFSMGVADAESMARLSALLVHATVDTASRSRAEVGLADGGANGRE